MKHTLLFFILIITMFLSCKTTKPFSYSVIRENYFDTNYFKLNLKDTNQINKNLYEGIFDIVELDASAKYLLMRIYSAIGWEEYGLYDYKTGKYFYTSIEDNLYQFKEMGIKRSQRIYNQMNEFVHHPEQLVT